MNYKKIIPIIFLFLALVNGVLGAPSVNDTILYYTFDNDGFLGGTVIDLTTFNNGTVSGHTTGITGKLGETFNLTGTNSQINVSSSTSLGGLGTTDQFTITGWFMPRDNDKYIFTIGSDSISVGIGTGGLTNKMTIYTGFSWAGSSCSVNYNAWNYLTYVQNGSSTSFYLNGSLCSTASPGAPGNTGGLNVKIGSNPVNGNRLTSLIDEFAIFNYSLSASDVSYLYNSGSPGVLQRYPYVTNNFTVSAKEISTNAAISNFSANISGIIYNTTSGSIVTNIQSNATQFFNITILNAEDNNGKLFNRTYQNVNVSMNLNAQLIQAQVNLTAYEFLTNTTLSGSFSGGVVGSANNILFVKSGLVNLTFLNNSYVNKTVEFNIPALFNSTRNLTNVSNSIINISLYEIYNNNSIFGFTGYIYNPNYGYNESFSTSNSFIELPALLNLNWTIYVTNTSYAITSSNVQTKNASARVMNYSFYLYTTNTLSFTFKDEDTNTQITWDNMTIELIGSFQSYNFSTTTGNYTASLIVPQTYTARYFGTKYAERFYYFTLVNGSYNDITLYSINKTLKSNLTVTIIDQDTNPLENAQVQSLKYYLTPNSYILQEIGTTDVNGETVMSVTLNDEFYKFIVVYNGVILKTTNPAYITGNTLTIQVVVGEPSGINFYEWQSISSDISFNTATDNFRLDYVDATGLSTNICLNTYRWTAGTRTQLNSSCSTSSSGTILSSVTPSNGTMYEATSTYTKANGEIIQLSRLSYTYPVTNVLGTTGLLIQIFFTMTVVFLTAWNLPLAVIMVPITLIIGSALRLNVFPITTIIPVAIMAIVLAFMLNKTK